ncbi:hypothetical protein N7582_002294 [Saccharomyces uvarum]|uniref:Btn2p n=1 Tax=Saccharomyces uvarum TaxID=230603 RepID=A0AA35JKP2_SACUV|nr:hypothetical protein N7582_002294 [Saccharomyces uvarum]CAI4063090.1 hypothetical protein SUVC_07G3720 [Saccharomyces uvarum]
MFSVFNSPCVFEQLPTFNQSAHNFECGSPMNYQPECKRRRAVRANLRAPERRSRAESPVLKYALSETSNGYNLSLYKHIPYSLFSKYVNEKLGELKENHYRPTYHVVEDFFGNQYYVEDEVDEKALLRSALEDLDFKAIGKKIAKDLFQDYEIELNHRGDELSILSKKDNISKDFCLDEVFEDVFVIGCGVENIDDDSSDKYALLKIGLVKHERKNVLLNSKQPEMLQNEVTQEQPQEEVRTFYSSPQNEEGEEMAEPSLTKDEQIKRWVEEERLMQEESRQAKKEKLAKANQERQKKEKQAKLKAKKESLLKRQKARRAEQKKEQESNQSSTSKDGVRHNTNNTDVTESDNASTNSESEMDSDFSITSNTLKKHVSPILEEIEDEEIDRYNELLTRSPRGNSIIEDI